MGLYKIPGSSNSPKDYARSAILKSSGAAFRMVPPVGGLLVKIGLDSTKLQLISASTFV